jgi:hypothetical protein
VSAHVVILGCGRSGTSIFGELFEHLPGYRYLFEPPFAALGKIDWSAGPVATKVPKRPPGEATTDGLPFALDELLAIIPEPRIFYWQIRHPYDAVCSLQPGISEGWSHNPRPPDWTEWLDKPVVMRCARHWQYINEVGFKAAQEFVRRTRYEDMVDDPIGFARQKCEEIGVGADVVGAAQWAALVSNRKASDSYEAKHQVRWSRQDHKRRVERWRENLSSSDIEMIAPIVRAAGRLHGYAI